MLKFFHRHRSDVIFTYEEPFHRDLMQKPINQSLFVTGTDSYPPCRLKHDGCVLTSIPVEAPKVWCKVSPKTVIPSMEMDGFESIWRYLQFLSQDKEDKLDTKEKRAFLYRVLAFALGYRVC